MWLSNETIKVAEHSFGVVGGVVQKPARLLRSKANKNKRGVKTAY